MKNTESSLYPAIRDMLEELFRTRFKDGHVHLEITANRQVSNALKELIPTYRDIIFTFLKTSRPDITGTVTTESGVQFIVAEVKPRALKLEDIYQTRRYADLLDAQYAMLVSTEEIPAELVRLSQVIFPLLSLKIGHATLRLVYFNKKADAFVHWVPSHLFA